MQLFNIYIKSKNNIKSDKLIANNIMSCEVQRIIDLQKDGVDIIVKTGKIITKPEMESSYNTKLHLYHHGDQSVGINGEQFQVDVPFDVNSASWDELEYFRNTMSKLYAEYCEFHLHVEYSYEMMFDEQF